MAKLYLGSQEITPAFFESAGVKYGATINNFLGNVDGNGTYNIPQSLAHIVFDGVKHIGNYGMKYLFNSATQVESVDFPDLEDALGTHALYCAFTDCATMTSFTAPKLTRIGGYACYSTFVRTNISVLNFPELITIDGYGLQNACYESHVTEVTFPKLNNLGGGALYQFLRNTSTFNNKSLSFPALKSTSFGGATNQFNQMLIGTTGVTVHFPSNLQSVIGSWSDVTAGFGGTSTTVLFDLPATE